MLPPCRCFIHSNSFDLKSHISYTMKHFVVVPAMLIFHPFEFIWSNRPYIIDYEKLFLLLPCRFFIHSNSFAPLRPYLIGYETFFCCLPPCWFFIHPNSFTGSRRSRVMWTRTVSRFSTNHIICIHVSWCQGPSRNGPRCYRRTRVTKKSSRRLPDNLSEAPRIRHRNHRKTKQERPRSPRLVVVELLQLQFDAGIDDIRSPREPKSLDWPPWRNMAPKST